ncbi:MAG: 5-(carboxyamino)imidazole ribonucleotide synthase [Candidatus Levybacteria bacterium]|nr:5-(carboxyamino)imidazole ribonucleotide synthase [Candidatus Levybacteria bacterium]
MKNRIGIVGGGQLARMLIPSAKHLGFTVTILDPTPKSPAGQLADKQIVADLNDEKAMWELAHLSDFMTFDWELANPELLEEIKQKGITVNPSPQTLRMIKDKYEQKVFLKKAGIPVAEFVDIPSCHAEFISASKKSNVEILKQVQDDIKKIAKRINYPFLLKAKTGAYDGRGNFVVKTQNDITKGLEKLKGNELYVEKFIPFEKELAIIAVRSLTGKIKTFPVVETIHKNNILQTVLAPAPISKPLSKKAESLAKKVMQHLKGAGVFGIEMFLTHSTSSGQAQILVNEIAPRVHNSGHVTIESSITSQFEQHIRAVTGLPLGRTLMKTPAAVMINILGERNGTAKIKGLEEALKIPGVSIHMYGKAETKMERKMGHITSIGPSLEICLKRVKKARRLISI